MWQRLADETRLALTSVAVDVQGPDVVRPWTTVAGATFPTLVDAAGVLSARFGLFRVPVILACENGRLVQPPTVLDVREPEAEAAVRAWATHSTATVELPPLPERPVSREKEAALAWLELGRLALADGRRDEALAHLDNAFKLDPENLLVRKQRWALREPDRFYSEEIDLDWQKVQMAEGR